MGAVIVATGIVVARAAIARSAPAIPPRMPRSWRCARPAQALGTYRLTGTTLYVTLEPCAMCASAMVHARVQRLVFAATDPRAGAPGSVFNIVQHPALNHRLECTGGVLAEECGSAAQAVLPGATLTAPTGSAPPGPRSAAGASEGRRRLQWRLVRLRWAASRCRRPRGCSGRPARCPRSAPAPSRARSRVACACTSVPGSAAAGTRARPPSGPDCVRAAARGRARPRRGRSRRCRRPPRARCGRAPAMRGGTMRSRRDR